MQSKGKWMAYKFYLNETIQCGKMKHQKVWKPHLKLPSDKNITKHCISGMKKYDFAINSQMTRRI